jgi:hypothetical protein
MNKLFSRTLALAGMAVLVLPAAGTAEVRHIEIDIAGYLCGA